MLEVVRGVKVDGGAEELDEVVDKVFTEKKRFD